MIIEFPIENRIFKLHFVACTSMIGAIALFSLSYMIGPHVKICVNWIRATSENFNFRGTNAGNGTASSFSDNWNSVKSIQPGRGRIRMD